jgi:hypothetical protein
LLGGWLWSCGVVGNWRIGFAVLLSEILALGWNVAALNAVNGVWIGLEKQIEKERIFWRSSFYGDDEDWMRHHRLNIERIEKLDRCGKVSLKWLLKIHSFYHR